MTVPDESLRSGVAVVTGGAGTGAGLGRGLVMALSRRGMRVAVLDIDLDAANDVLQQVRSEGGEAMACKVDLAEPETLRRAADAVGSTFGACNVLCAHAVTGVNPLADDPWSPDEWRRAMDGIVVGTVATVHAFLPLIRQTRGLRRVVFTASSVALAPGRFQGSYRAGKVAVVSIAESLALELEPEGIDTMIVFPNGMTSKLPDASGGSGAERARQAVDDALAGLDLPPHIVARYAAIGEEMASDPTDLATAEAVASTVVDGIVRGRRYVITHGRSFEGSFRARQRLLEEAFAELADRGYGPVSS